MRTRLILTVSPLAILLTGLARGETVNFTVADVKAAIGALHDATHQRGLWAVRARPVVTGGGFTMTGASTTQSGWGALAPSSYSWNTYGTGCAWFYDHSGAEVAGDPSNPLYMIMDVAQDNFWSSSFNKSGSWVGDYSPGGGGTWYASGYDDGAGGTNLITAAADAGSFSFSFALDGGASWSGQWEFLVDGSKYTLGTYAAPGSWIENFFGDYGDGGGLVGNTGTGFLVPEPAGMALLGLGGVAALARRRRRT